MDARIRELLTTCTISPGANHQSIEAAEQRLSVALPRDYVALLRFTNGCAGLLGPNYVNIYTIESVRWYTADEYMPLPFLLFIGSNGGAEGYAYDTRQHAKWPIVNVPFIGMEEQLIRVVGSSILEFLERLRDAPLFQ
jgi:hypothetical protein